MMTERFENFDEVGVEGETGVWTIVETHDLEPRYKVQLGRDASTVKYVRSETLTLIKKPEKLESGPRFYPSRGILG